MAHPQNATDCVAVNVLEGYARRQVGGSADERFVKRVQLEGASRKPKWWGCDPEESSLDLPGGKSLAAPQEGITLVAKLILTMRGTKNVAF